MKELKREIREEFKKMLGRMNKGFKEQEKCGERNRGDKERI